MATSPLKLLSPEKKPIAEANALGVLDWTVIAVIRTKTSKHLHKDARAQEMPHLLQDLLLKYVPRHCSLQIQNKRIPKPARSIKFEALQLVLESLLMRKIQLLERSLVPAALLSRARPVTHQQDNLLRLPAVLVGTLRRSGGFLYLCLNPVVVYTILHVVLVEICMWASCNLRHRYKNASNEAMNEEWYLLLSDRADTAI